MRSTAYQRPCEGGVDAGSTHHGSVIAGGTDRKAEAGSEEAHHGGTGQRDDYRRQHQLIPAAREAQGALGDGEDGIGLDQ